MTINKCSFFTVLLSVFAGSISAVSAQDCGSNYSICCETSYCDGKFKLGAEWLYWKGEQDNMALAQTNAGNSDKTSPDYLNSSVHRINPNYKYRNGFKIMGGYEFPCNGWEIDVIYTNLPIHAKSSLVAASNPLNAVTNGSTGPFTVIEPNDYYLVLNTPTKAIRGITGNEASYETFQEKWTLNFNQLDVDIGRTMCFNDCISIRPHAGFRTAWYTDKQNANFTGVASNPLVVGSPTSTFEENAKLRNKFTGYGVEAGIWANWQIGCGLSFVGHFGGSVLYSKFTINQDVATVVITNESESTSTTNFSNTLHDVNHVATPTMEYFFGLEYADAICEMTFAIRGGWEQIVYYNTNRIFQAGNLSMQGLTLGIEIGF